MTEAEIKSIVLRAQARVPVGADEVRRLGERALEVRAAAHGAKIALESGDAATALLLLNRACR